MDLTPEALIQRLREGKVYPPERIPTALNSFFRVENLSSLREVALRQVAEEVESRRLITPAEAARHARGEALRRRADGRGRTRARAGHARGGLAAPGAARLALGAASRGGARPALRGAPRRSRREARSASGSRLCAASRASSARS